MSKAKPAAPPLESGSELTWPPPDDARFGTGILDLEAGRVISIDEAARELDGSATERAEPQPAPPADVPVARPDRRPVPPTAARSPSALLSPVRSVPPGRLSRPSLTMPLAAIAIVQAIVLVAVFVRGRSPREPIQPAKPVTAVHSATPTPQPAVVPAQALNVPDPRVPVESLAPSRPDNVVPAVPAEGHLLVRSDPAGASVLIDGRRRGVTPLVVDGLAAGPHRVQISSSGTSVEQVVAIEAGSTTTIVVPMNAGAGSAGWVSVAAPIALQVFENRQLLGTAADGPVRLASGSHRLELANESLGYRAQQTVTVRAGEVVRVRPSIPDGVLHVNAVPWANVWVDGEPAGETPLANLRVAPGPHEIRFRHPSLGEQVRQVIVSLNEPARVSVNMKP